MKRILGWLRGTYSARAWAATAFTALTTLISTVSFILVLVLLVSGASLLIVALLGLPLLWAAVFAARQNARLDAWRFAVLLGDELRLRPLPRPSGARPNWLARSWAMARAGGSWLAVVYTLLVQPVVGWVGGWLVASAWGGGLAFLLFPAYSHNFPLSGRLVGVDLGLVWSTVVHVVIGMAALIAAPWLARGVVYVHLSLARWLLSPRRTEVLSQRVEDLESSRAGMVAAAAAERRRIERDLHDGAQQRLVSVAMTLGRAQERFRDNPAAAEELISEAHVQAKRALEELRNLARGIHPAVLTDRGLPAAIAGLAASCPVPVTVDVDVEPRPSAEVEAVAYFFVAEALTNIARHADATTARVSARRVGDRLEVEVADDGRGGAREDAGTGLAGLRDRALAVDGTFSVRSAPGEGTTLRMDLPCQN
ncbi:MAG: sensor domain-containing protein [Frankia sp.]|nr:sensor domain-containing protein [Frankia sp.]